MKSNEVLLSKSGILTSAGGNSVSDPLAALGARLALENGTTLRSVINLLKHNPDLQRLSPFSPSLAQLASHPQDKTSISDLERLEFSRVVEIIGAPEPPRLEVFHILRGCTRDQDDLEIRNWEVKSLLDIPLIMGALRHRIFGDSVHAFRFDTVCTLFDFIDGIVWQLAFHGAPEECALRR